MLVLLLVAIPPVGIWLAWRSGWPQRRKVLATGLSALWLALVVFAEPEESADDAEVAAAETEADVVPDEAPRDVPDYTGQNLAVAVEAAEAAGYQAVSHDATDGDAAQTSAADWTVCFQTPEVGASIVPGGTVDFAVVREGESCPASDGLAVLAPTVPSVVELAFGEAVGRLAEYGLTEVEARSAFRDVELPDEHDDWLVCFQRPDAGAEILRAAELPVLLSLSEPGVACPRFDNDQLNPEPEPEPDPEPDPEPGGTTTGGDSGGSGGSGGGSEGGADDNTGGSTGEGDQSGGSVFYENCDAVRAAAAAPLLIGEPGYARHLDRDGDGVACET